MNQQHRQDAIIELVVHQRQRGQQRETDLPDDDNHTHHERVPQVRREIVVREDDVVVG